MRGIPSRWAECPVETEFTSINDQLWVIQKLIGAGLVDFHVIPSCSESVFVVVFHKSVRPSGNIITLELLSFKADIECFPHSTS